MNEVLAKPSLRELLLPSLPQITRLLVDASGANLLRQFGALAMLLSRQVGLPAPLRESIRDSLSVLGEREPEMLSRMLASPLFRGWYSQFGKLAELDGSDARLFGLLRAWNNHIFSLYYPGDYEGWLAVQDGVCSTWDCMLVIRVADRPDIFVRKRALETRIYDKPGGQLLIAFQCEPRNGAIVVHGEPANGISAVLPKGVLPGTDVAVRNDIPELCLRLSGSLERQTAISEERDLSPASYDPNFDIGEFLDAAELLRLSWPEEYGDFTQTLQVVVPRGVPVGWRARGMTVSSYQGAVWLMARGILPIFENLVHEQSHVKLRYIEEWCPILREEQSELRYKIGWRTDPRPIVGIYEGVYVHLHMLMALRLLENADQSVVPSGVIAGRACTLAGEVKDGIELLKRAGRFTHDGCAFIEWAEQCILDASADIAA